MNFRHLIVAAATAGAALAALLAGAQSLDHDGLAGTFDDSADGGLGLADCAGGDAANYRDESAGAVKGGIAALLVCGGSACYRSLSRHGPG